QTPPAQTPPAQPAPDQQGSAAPAAPAQQQTAAATAPAAAPAGGAASGMVAMVEQADVAKGEKVTKKCVACHSLEQGGPNKVGPHLWDRFGHPIASVEDYNYSSAMKSYAAEAKTWTVEHLDAFLADPKGTVPGTKMAFPGLKKDDERAAAIAYLHSLSADPAPIQ
ncbi:c-type cytochrome, partial [Propylenella binzhouense]